MVKGLLETSSTNLQYNRCFGARTSLKDHITQEQWEKTAERMDWIKTGKRPNMKKLYRLLKDKKNKQFESALNEVFKNHRKLKDFSPEELLLFWYFLAGFVDGDGFLWKTN
jgi:hypothetical protein